MQDDPTILSVTGLKKHFPVQRGFLKRTIGRIKAVDGVDFEIEYGKTLGLVGESGCGKSTVARLLLRLIKPDMGTVVYQGRDMGTLMSRDMKQVREQIQIIFQDPFGSLNPRMTAGQSVEEGLRAAGMKGRIERRTRVKELLGMVGMAASAEGRYPHEFSGGQRQRIGIARALSVDPSLIICDEPISALDVSIQAQIINLLRDLQDDLGISYLFISHDLNVVGYISHKAAVMYLGQIMESAPSEVLYEHPLHPYTRILLSAIPSSAGFQDKSSRVGLFGEVPTPFNPPPGCKFQGRCKLVEERCRSEEIGWYESGPGHFVRCWKTVSGGR